jgi:hypothetical protein
MSPILGSLDQARTDGIPLDVTADDQEMIIVGNGKTLETGLVQVSLAGGVIVGVATLRVRRRDPSQQTPHLPVLGRPQHHVPVVGHQRGRGKDPRPLFCSKVRSLASAKLARTPAWATTCAAAGVRARAVNPSR